MKLYQKVRVNFVRNLEGAYVSEISGSVKTLDQGHLHSLLPLETNLSRLGIEPGSPAQACVTNKEGAGVSANEFLRMLEQSNEKLALQLQGLPAAKTPNLPSRGD